MYTHRVVTSSVSSSSHGGFRMHLDSLIMDGHMVHNSPQTGVVSASAGGDYSGVFKEGSEGMSKRVQKFC